MGRPGNDDTRTVSLGARGKRPPTPAVPGQGKLDGTGLGKCIWLRTLANALVMIEDFQPAKLEAGQGTFVVARVHSR